MSQEAASEPLLQADERTFASADLNNDGKITRGEVVHFVDFVFLSVDFGGNGQVTPEEFKAWDIGYVQVAAAMGKTAAFDQSKEAVYRELDLNDDGIIEHEEMSAAALYFFYTADVDKSRFLDQEEFTQEFEVLKNLRAPLE
jgi:Ca2+-binding EF-hand superfamily protein